MKTNEKLKKYIAEHYELLDKLKEIYTDFLEYKNSNNIGAIQSNKTYGIFAFQDFLDTCELLNKINKKPVEKLNSEELISAYKLYKIKNPKEITYLIKYYSKDGKFDNTDIINAIAQNLEKIKSEANPQLPFSYKHKIEENVIIVKSKTIKLYIEDANKANPDNPFKEFISKISIQDGKILIECFNKREKTDELVYSFTLEATPEGLDEFVRNIYFYCGFMGFVRGNIQNSFNYSEQPNKFEYDGIAAYTVSSSGINRVLRYIEKDYEFKGDEANRLIRVINGCDSYFEKTLVNSSIDVYRGLPLSDARMITGVKEGELTGGIMSNSGYTSTTLNLQSTLLFAHPNGCKDNGGCLLRITLPRLTNCDYIHNLAGWEEQFEVLLDRKYDIQVGKKIIEFKGKGDLIYYLYEGILVPHQNNGNIASFTKMCLEKNEHYTEIKKEVPEIYNYDEEGKVLVGIQFQKDLLRNAFDILRKKGITCQYQDSVDINSNTVPMIVVRGKAEANQVNDFSFAYFTNKSNKLSVFNIVGSDESVKNYWSDRNRNNGELDRNFSWETYNYNKDKAQMKGIDEVFIENKDKDVTAEDIAKVIEKYIKYNDNCIAYPLQDICRFFDTIMKQVIVKEGYILKTSQAVKRTGDVNNEDDGFVEISYTIDGDDDDNLDIKFKFERKKGKNTLNCTYSGKSSDGKVDSTKELSWDIFNKDIMIKTCEDILYEFAKQLDLNHTRRVKQLVEQYCKYQGFIFTNKKLGLNLENKNIHEKGFEDKFSIYFTRRRISGIDISVEVDKETHKVFNFIAKFFNQNNEGKTINFVIYDSTMNTMVHNLQEKLLTSTSEEDIDKALKGFNKIYNDSKNSGKNVEYNLKHFNQIYFSFNENSKAINNIDLIKEYVNKNKSVLEAKYSSEMLNLILGL